MFSSILITTVLASTLVQAVHAQYNNPAYGNFSGPNGPLVDLGYTKIQGTTYLDDDLGINAFLGVRFAAPPVRFSAPVAIESVTPPGLTHDGSTFGPYCYNVFSASAPASLVLPLIGLTGREPSEDCLLLDIFTPQNATSAKLPVLINIHGGGYAEGGSTTTNVLWNFATSPGQLIVINIQYRLAGFGFLPGSDVASKGTLNVGLKDQRLALEWVQRHAAAFGGDPSRVTINGGSAGGGSVIYQLIWNGGEDNPPYSAGVSQFPYLQAHDPPAAQETIYRNVLKTANCSDISCLRALSSDAYNTVQQQAVYNQPTAYGLFFYGPVVDGVNIRDLPSKELQASHFSKVPLITTRDGNEGLSFTPSNITTAAEYQARVEGLFPSGGASFFGRLNDYYPKNLSGPYGYQDEETRTQFVFGSYTIQCPSYWLASSAVDAFSFVNATSQLQPVWKFIYGGPNFLTAYHGAHAFLIQNIIPATDMSVNAETGRVFQQYFNNFAINRDPNIPTAYRSAPVDWPEYGSSSTILLFGNSSTPLQIHDIDASGVCDFLWAQPYVTYN